MRLSYMPMKVCPECHTKYTRAQEFCPRDGAHLVQESVEKGKTQQLYDPNIGVILDDRYRLLTRIGEGSSAVVYSALQIMLNRRVAVKTLRDEFTGDKSVVERFIKEAHVASSLSHPNIVAVLDSGKMDDGTPYLVMEHLYGGPLSEELKSGAPMEPGRAINIMTQVCRALASAHRRGIIHRNLKPDNIFLLPDDDTGREVVKVVDFANTSSEDGSRLSLTKTGLISGTPEYMSPEQAEGKSTDALTDIYSAGVILYELLTGRPPFKGDSLMGTLGKHLFEPVPDPRSFVPATDPGLVKIVNKALAKKRAERFATMDEFAGALLQFSIHGKSKVSEGNSSISSAEDSPHNIDLRKDNINVGEGAASGSTRGAHPPPHSGKRARRARKVLRIRFDEEEREYKPLEKTDRSSLEDVYRLETEENKLTPLEKNQERLKANVNNGLYNEEDYDEEDHSEINHSEKIFDKKIGKKTKSEKGTTHQRKKNGINHKVANTKKSKDKVLTALSSPLLQRLVWSIAALFIGLLAGIALIRFGFITPGKKAKLQKSSDETQRSMGNDSKHEETESAKKRNKGHSGQSQIGPNRGEGVSRPGTDAKDGETVNKGEMKQPGASLKTRNLSSENSVKEKSDRFKKSRVGVNSEKSKSSKNAKRTNKNDGVKSESLKDKKRSRESEDLKSPF